MELVGEVAGSRVMDNHRRSAVESFCFKFRTLSSTVSKMSMASSPIEGIARTTLTDVGLFLPTKYGLNVGKLRHRRSVSLCKPTICR